jgi:hypothetical protein
MDENEVNSRNTEIPYEGLTPTSPMMVDDTDENLQPITAFNWEDSNMYSSKTSMDCCTIVSIPSKEDSIDADSSLESNLLDSPLDYRIDWTDDVQNSLRNSSYENSSTSRNEDDMLMADDCIEGIYSTDCDMIRLSEGPLDQEEAKSLLIWMKSSETTDIWT